MAAPQRCCRHVTSLAPAGFHGHLIRERKQNMPDIPDVPPELSVNCEVIAYRGEGVQIYQCTRDGRWAFQSPRASLYDDGRLAAGRGCLP